MLKNTKTAAEYENRIAQLESENARLRGPVVFETKVAVPFYMRKSFWLGVWHVVEFFCDVMIFLFFILLLVASAGHCRCCYHHRYYWY